MVCFTNIYFHLEAASCRASHGVLSQAVAHRLVTANNSGFIPKRFSILLLMPCDKSALIHSQLIYVYSTNKWFNTSSNDLYVSDLLMPEKAPAEVYVCRSIKPSTQQYIIATDCMLETTDLSRAEENLNAFNYRRLKCLACLEHFQGGTRQKESCIITALAFTPVNITHLSCSLPTTVQWLLEVWYAWRQKGNLTLTAEMTQGPHIVHKEPRHIKSKKQQKAAKSNASGWALVSLWRVS